VSSNHMKLNLGMSSLVSSLASRPLQTSSLAFLNSSGSGFQLSLSRVLVRNKSKSMSKMVTSSRVLYIQKNVTVQTSRDDVAIIVSNKIRNSYRS
jgi:hypothetical protein